MKVSPRSFRKFRILLPLVVIVIALALIPTVRVSSALNRLSADATAVQRWMQNGALQALPPDPSNEVDTLLAQSIADLRDLRASLGGFSDGGGMFGWLPRYGGDLANASALLDFGEQATLSAQEALVIGRALNDEIESGKASHTPVGASVLRASQKQSALIQQARQNLAQVKRARSRIDAAQLSPSLREMVYRFDALLPFWQAGLDGLALAPKLLGGDRPRVYLLLLQNSDELRATGGFISAVARVRVVQGDVTVSDFQDSYAVDDLSKPHPTPPNALAKYMFAGTWVLRDANWSPDFATAARAAENIYRIDRGVEVDGVIAVNLNLVPRLLEALGPVTVESYNERVDSTNALQKIQTHWAPPALNPSAEYWQHRKDFAGNLLDAMMLRFRNGDADRTRLARALFEAITAKDLLIYLNDLDLDAQSGFPWNGALHTGSGDALMIVDSNLGFNKVDGNIQRAADYSVSLDSDPIKATLTITYTNLSPATTKKCELRPTYPPRYAELQQGCYWDYVRVAAPKGSELIGASGLEDVATEIPSEARTIFGGYFVLARSESKTIRLEYRLPPKLKDASTYTLLLEKQPGKSAMPVSVRVAFPTSWYPVFDTPPAREAASAHEFSITLERDQEIQVGFDQSQPMRLAIASVFAGMILLGLGYWTRRLR